MPHQILGQKAIALIAATDQVPIRLLEDLRQLDAVFRDAVFRRGVVRGVVRGGTYLGREVCERVTTGRRTGVTRGVVRVT